VGSYCRLQTANCKLFPTFAPPMRFIATSILLILLMSQAFSNWFILAAFRLERDYIAKNLCENRYRPKMHCNGNCVLMKRLRQEEKKEQNAPSSLKIEIQVLSSRSFFASIDPVNVPDCRYYTAVFNTGKPVDRSFSFFHPPAA